MVRRAPLKTCWLVVVLGLAHAPLFAQETFLAKDADAKLKSLLEELQQTEGLRLQQAKDASGVYFVCEIPAGTDRATGTSTYRNIFVWTSPYKLSDGGILKDRRGHEIVKVTFQSIVYQLPEAFTPPPTLFHEMNKLNAEDGVWVRTLMTSDATQVVQMSQCWLRSADAAIINEELLELAHFSTATARNFQTIVQGLQAAP